MRFRGVAIAGGAGFVGSNLAVFLRESFPHTAVTCFDNLSRRGSELNLERLTSHGVGFVHGDIRVLNDFLPLGDFDLLIDCAAEPSVHAGASGSPRHVLDVNLAGTINCLEAARSRGAATLFLSTSRVYPIRTLNDLPYRETPTRFQWSGTSDFPGFSERGVAEAFPLIGSRSFYGASKLACELLIAEYADAYGMKALIDRCGVIAGPWQMGKVDQGVVTLWVARHFFQKPLRYTGFGGMGKQVRDVLHVRDLFELLTVQFAREEVWDGRVYNVGGGLDGSVSLRELTDLCVGETGRRVAVGASEETAAVDLRIFVADSRRVERDFGWRPRRGPADVVRDVHVWLRDNRSAVEPFFA